MAAMPGPLSLSSPWLIMDNKIKARLFQFFAVLTGLIVAVVLAESTLRLLEIGYGNAPLESDFLLHHRHPKGYTFRVHIPSNDYGGHLIRYDLDGRSVNPAKTESGEKKDSLRIAFMGDSFVEATEVPFTESVVGLMEKEGFGVIRNYGVSAYSPVLHLLQWKHEVEKFAPHYVFLLLYSNDIGEDATYSEKSIKRDGEIIAVPGSGNTYLTSIFRKSYFARLIRKSQLRLEWLIKNRNNNGEEVIQSYLEENPGLSALTERTLLALRDEIRSKRGELILMAVPSKSRLRHRTEKFLTPEFSDNIKKWSEVNNMQFVDLVPAFQKAAEEERLFFDRDIHFNRNGHRIVFEAIKSAFSTIAVKPPLPSLDAS